MIVPRRPSTRSRPPMAKASAESGLVLSTADGRPYLAQIHDQLLARIRAGELRPGERLPSLRQMAAECSVSLGIVKQAVNTLCVEGHLRSHPGSGIFVAEPRQDWRMVSLVLPALDDFEMPGIIRGVKAGLAGSERRMLIQAADYDFNQEMDLLALLDPAHIGGAIIYPPPLSARSGQLREVAQRMPMVLISTVLDGLGIDGVEVDHLVIGEAAFAQLLNQGHRRIGIVDHNGDSLSDRELRLGVQEALGRHGLKLADLPKVTTEVTDLNPIEPWANGERAGRALLTDHPDLTAVVGFNNYLALGVFRAIKSLGLRIPQDLSLVAISDLPAFNLVEPGINAVGSDYEALGRRAAMRLVARLGGTAGLPRIERLAPVITTRGSVGAPRPG